MASAPGVTVRGVDTSDVMVGMARDRLDGAIRGGHADLEVGEVSSLPYAGESFEKALSVHSIYFWADPVADLGEIQKVLIPGGLFVVTIDPTKPMQGKTATLTGSDTWSENALISILEHSGLMETGSKFEDGLVCAWGRKAPTRHF